MGFKSIINNFLGKKKTVKSLVNNMLEKFRSLPTGNYASYTYIDRSSDFIYLTVILATSILQPLYFFTRRNRHRELILKMEELHQLVNPRRRSIE